MLPHQNIGNTVPNGIAYDAGTTGCSSGKNWPKL
jgi:hypothetical protein